MVKKVRGGQLWFEDYEGQNIEVARQANTGFVVSRVDHLNIACYVDDANASDLLDQQSEKLAEDMSGDDASN